MRVHYMSDLHLEFDAMQSLGAAGETLLLAGDITLASCLDPGKTDAKSRKVRQATHRLLEMVRENFDQTFIIGGNHEPYGADIFEAEALCREHLSGDGVRWLENEVVEVGGIAFLFATLWTDMNNRNPVTMMDVGRAMSDFYLIEAAGKRWTTSMAADRFDESFAFIQREVEARPNQSVVVVTHHVPSHQGIHPRFKANRINGGFASSLDAFIANHPNIRHWVFGHTHVVTEFAIGETQLHANCRGYPGENTGFKIDACFEV